MSRWLRGAGLKARPPLKCITDTDWRRRSLIIQGALLAYYQAIEWVNVFPWNDIRQGNGQASLDLMVGVVVGMAMLATWRGIRWAMAAGTGLYGLRAWLQFDSWWMPYFRGASPAWKRTYGRFFGETIKFLPWYGLHLAPDACHMVLQALILAAVVGGVLAVLQRRLPQAGSLRRHMFT